MRRPAEEQATSAAAQVGERQRLHLLLAQLSGRRAAGRLAGSPGARFAAALIARHWTALGLEPPDEAGYLRPVPVPALRLQRGPLLSFGAVTF
jgi:hypothetical protein